MRSGMRGALGAWVALSALTVLDAAACSSSPSPGPSAGPVERTLGGFQVTVEASPPRVRVSAGTRSLADLDGRAIAFRSGAATYVEQYGSFQIADTSGPESVTDHFSDVLDIAPTATAGAAIELGLVDAKAVEIGRLRVSLEGDGHLAVTATPKDAAASRARMGLSCAPTDHFTGLGAQTADVDQRGQRVPLFASEHGVGKSDIDDDTRSDWFLRGNRHSTYAPIPAVTTSRGTAWVLDTSAYSVFDLCATTADSVGLEAWEGQLRFHLFDGPSPLEALARMTAFVGRPPMPPPWAFAPWNDALFGPDNVLKFARFLRDQGIPSSAIWSEDWRGGSDEQYGYRIKPNWRVDTTLYPDLPGLIAQLAKLGIAMQVYFNPHVIEGADVFADARDHGHLVTHVADGTVYTLSGADGTFGGTALTDLTRPETRAWAKALLREALDAGARGWMADFGEWLPVDDAKLASGADPALTHNRYPHLWQEINQEAIAEAGLTGQVAVYFRSAGLRSQSTASIVWAGDQRTDMEPDNGLPVIVPIGLGLASTGFPFYAHDIGGYQYLGNVPTQIRTKETFFRWTELGAFTPVMRTHHGIKVKENWTIDSDAETTAHWKRYASLHVQLYPYLRGLAVRAVNEGRPLWIPLGLVHPDDAAAWPVKDEFYLGDGMLVAPVVQAGAVSRAVQLPAGRFVPMFAGAAVTGPANIAVDAPLGEIPVFLRAGTIVPMTKTPAMTLLEGVAGIDGLESTRGDRTAYVALGASGRFREEDGASYALDGTGTDVASLALDADGAIEVTGNTAIAGTGFTLTLTGHPDTRKTRVIFR